MATKVSYTDVVHDIVRDAEQLLSLNDIVDKLNELVADNPPKNSRSTVRSALRTSGLIMSVGNGQHDWLPRLLKNARLRITLHPQDLAAKRLHWDTDALLAQWPAAEEPETRRQREDVLWSLDSGAQVVVSLQEEGDQFFSEPNEVFWTWLDEKGVHPGDDLIITASDPVHHKYELSFEARNTRSSKLIEERNRLVKRRTEEFLKTQRDNLAKPREVVASLMAAQTYHDSVPPQTISNLLPTPVLDRYGALVPPDQFDEQSRESNVIPFPNKAKEESAEHEGRSGKTDAHKSSVALDIPFNTGRELPDEKAYLEGLQLINEQENITPALAIHVLNLSRLCSPAYALLSQTSEFKREALDLAGQSVVAAERRIAHGLVESLISGEEFALEEAVADYLESRSFLARALWHAGNYDEAIEQAMHCFEVDPEDPAVREDLFVMLFDTDRHDMVIRLLESFPGASVTEDLYHRALAALLDDPDGKEAKKILRKAVSHNTHLACLFLGEDPKKSKKSSVDEAVAYEAAYGFLWRREDVIFDLLEEIVLAKR